MWPLLILGLLTYGLSHTSIYNLKANKNISDKLKSTNHIIIDIPKKTNKDVWENISNTIEAACREL